MAENKQQSMEAVQGAAPEQPIEKTEGRGNVADMIRGVAEESRNAKESLKRNMNIAQAQKREGLGAMLDRMIGRQNRAEALGRNENAMRAISKLTDKDGNVIEENEITLHPASPDDVFGEDEMSDEERDALRLEITRFAEEHPELQEKYSNFDDLAEYYLNEVKPKMNAANKTFDKAHEAAVNERISTQDFLDRLIK